MREGITVQVSAADRTRAAMIPSCTDRRRRRSHQHNRQAASTVQHQRIPAILLLGDASAQVVVYQPM